MKVTKLVQKTNNRIEVILDEEFSFVLYKGELRLYGVSEDKDISDENFKIIMTEVLPKRAKLRALNLLKVKPYTEKGLRDKLKDGGYPASIIDIAIEYVKSYHYIDDRNYAEQYINTYKDRKNRKKLFQDLINKGVDGNLIDEVMEMQFAEDDINYEEEQIKSFLKKKAFDPEKSSYEEKMKIMSSLYRKGFSTDLIRRCMDFYYLT